MEWNADSRERESWAALNSEATSRSRNQDGIRDLTQLVDSCTVAADPIFPAAQVSSAELSTRDRRLIHIDRPHLAAAEMLTAGKHEAEVWILR